MRRLIAAALLTPVLTTVLTACSDDSGNDTPTSQPSSPSAEESTGEDSGSGSTAEDIDLCALVTDAELEALFGAAPEGVFSEGAIGGSSCLWMDEATDTGLELGLAPEGVPAGDGVTETLGVLFFPLGGLEANLKYIDFSGDDHLDEITPLVEAIQSRV